MKRRGLISRLRRFRRDENGSPTIEFVILFPIYIYMLCTAWEIGLYLFRQIMLERGLDLTVRELRINDYEDKWGNSASFAEIKSGICANTPSIGNCESVLNLATDDIDNLRTPNWGQVTKGAVCANRSKPPPDDFGTPRWNTGGENHVVVISACWIYDPMFPTFGIAAEAPIEAIRDTKMVDGVAVKGGIGVTAVSAFAIEP